MYLDNSFITVTDKYRSKLLISKWRKNSAQQKAIVKNWKVHYTNWRLHCNTLSTEKLINSCFFSPVNIDQVQQS